MAGGSWYSRLLLGVVAGGIGELSANENMAKILRYGNHVRVAARKLNTYHARWKQARVAGLIEVFAKLYVLQAAWENSIIQALIEPVPKWSTSKPSGSTTWSRLML